MKDSEIRAKVCLCTQLALISSGDAVTGNSERSTPDHVRTSGCFTPHQGSGSHRVELSCTSRVG